MDDPLLYHKPVEADEPLRRRRSAQRAMIVGLLLFGAGAGMALCPLIWGRSSVNKYLVTFGFIGATWGLSCIVHGSWDWWRGRQ